RLRRRPHARRRPRPRGAADLRGPHPDLGHGMQDAARPRLIRPSAITRSLLVRQAAEVLLPETPDDVEPALVAAVLDVLCDLLAVEDGDPHSLHPSRNG